MYAVHTLAKSTHTHRRRRWQPLQCSHLENPRDGRAWWAVVQDGGARKPTMDVPHRGPAGSSLVEVAWSTQADDDVREAAAAPPAQVEPHHSLHFPEDRGEHKGRCRSATVACPRGWPVHVCGLSTWVACPRGWPVHVALLVAGLAGDRREGN